MKGTNLNAGVYHHLKTNTIEFNGLRHIELQNSNIGPECLKLVSEAIITNLKTLETACPIESVNLSFNNVCLRMNKSLSFIDDEESFALNYDSEGFAELCRTLIRIGNDGNGSRLRRINLSNNILGKEGFSCLSTLLTEGPSCMLDWNLSGCSNTPKMLLPLFDGLKICRSIISLDLSNNDMSHPVVAQSLADALGVNPRLKSLNLSNCRLGVDGACAVFTKIGFGGYLEHMCLSENNIGDVGCKAAASCFEINKKLKSLDLQENNITDEGVAYITDVVIRRKYLNFLGLRWNPRVTNKTALKIADMLKGDKNELRSFYILGTGIDADGINIIAAAIGNKKEFP